MATSGADVAARSRGVLLGQMVADAGILARWLQAEEQLLVEDALGAAVEGWGPEDIRTLARARGWEVAGAEPATYRPALEIGAGRYVGVGPPSNEAVAAACARKGCYTDDTNSALALAAHLVEQSALSASGVARKYADFFFDGPRLRGYPDTAKAVMYLVRDGVSVDQTGLPPHFPFPGGSFANGAAMRISPLGVAFREASPGAFATAVAAAVRSSHRHPEAVDGALVQAEAVRYVLARTPEAFDAPAFLAHLAGVCADAAMRNVLELLGERLIEAATAGPPSTEQDIEELRKVLKTQPRPGSGFDFQIASVHACPCALWAFARYGADRPMEAVQRTIALGGDADTTASMVGALCGALHGTAWIPQALLDGLENDGRGRDYAATLGDQLAALDLRDEHILP